MQEVQDFPVSKIIKCLEILKNYVVLEDEEDVTFIFYCKKNGAGNEARTRDPDLGKVVLYQLSYSRIIW